MLPFSRYTLPMMKNTSRRLVALVLANVLPANRAEVLANFRGQGQLVDSSLDRTFRGSGNAAARRAGTFEEWGGCGCDVCVVYGGDCANQMAREYHAEWHRDRRGVKTRGV